MLNQTCKTAIKAVIYLAGVKSGDKAGIKEISSAIGASEHTVGKTLQRLAKHNVINSMKGPAGGFFMDEHQLDQPVYNIVQTIEGKRIFRECGLGLSRCSETRPCPIHDEYKEARNMIEKIFRENSVRDLCGPVHQGLTFLAG